MARTAGKKAAPAKVEEDDDAEGWEDAVVDADEKEAANLRLRDWRDVERFREMKELRSLVDDDYGLEEIFHIPVKPRTDLGIPPVLRTPGKGAPAAKGAVPAKGAPVLVKGAPVPAKGAAPAKGVAAPVKGAVPAKAAAPVKGAAKEAHKPAPKAHATKPAKPATKAAKVKAKAKRK